MKIIYVFKFYVVISCLVAKPGDYTYKVYNAQRVSDTTEIHVEAEYHKKDTIIIMDEIVRSVKRDSLLQKIKN